MAGGTNTCARRTDGTAWCWGNNQYGRLGDGTTTNRSAPTQVAGLSNVTALDAGDYHTCARRTDGTAWCWGRADFGQIGDGATTQRLTPAAAALP